jgi:hypothetical protein
VSRSYDCGSYTSVCTFRQPPNDDNNLFSNHHMQSPFHCHWKPALSQDLRTKQHHIERRHVSNPETKMAIHHTAAPNHRDGAPHALLRRKTHHAAKSSATQAQFSASQQRSLFPYTERLVLWVSRTRRVGTPTFLAQSVQHSLRAVHHTRNQSYRLPLYPDYRPEQAACATRRGLAPNTGSWTTAHPQRLEAMVRQPISSRLALRSAFRLQANPAEGERRDTIGGRPRRIWIVLP